MTTNHFNRPTPPMMDFRDGNPLIKCPECSEPTYASDVHPTDAGDACERCIAKATHNFICNLEGCKHADFIATGIPVACPAGHQEIDSVTDDAWWKKSIEKAQLKARPVKIFKGYADGSRSLEEVSAEEVKKWQQPGRVAWAIQTVKESGVPIVLRAPFATFTIMRDDRGAS